MNYKKTITACFFSYTVQAIIVNFAPLLFLIFNKSFNIPLSKITLLIGINFVIQLTVDFIAAFFADKIGFRACAITANGFSFLGLASMAILPNLFNSPFTGLLISVILYSLGGGLLEVVVSPIVEACPTDNKASVMSILHSYYAWGSAAVILLSTLFLGIFGTASWRILTLIWALLPLITSLLFIKVPIAPLIAEGEKGLSLKQLFSTPLFWLLFALMVCSGACEQSVAQWASTLTEKGLGISKTLGDILGPAMFAITMGITRTFYGKKGESIDLKKFMVLCGSLCIVSYLLIAVAPLPFVALIGCGLCGLSAGIMWPGTLSISSANIPLGGTAMFALLAVGGDLGCSIGPSLTGIVSSAMGDNLRYGILAAIIFPILLVCGTIFLKKKTTK